MKRSQKFLAVGAIVFTVFAWLSLVMQLGAGLYVLVVGGPSVPFGGLDVPARLVGVVSCLGGALYFFLLLLVAHVLRVLLEISKRLEPRSPPGG